MLGRSTDRQWSVVHLKEAGKCADMEAYRDAGGHGGGRTGRRGRAVREVGG